MAPNTKFATNSVPTRSPYLSAHIVDFGIFSILHYVLNHVYVCVSLLSIAYCLSTTLGFQIQEAFSHNNVICFLLRFCTLYSSLKRDHVELN